MPYTPGPWKWFDYPDGRKLLSAEERAVIHCPDAPITIEPADALLIAAAPDLLGALNVIIDTTVPWGVDARAAFDAAMAANAKAEGK